jgi:acyl-coenzyme A thioesterase PaaI-like protein
LDRSDIEVPKDFELADLGPGLPRIFGPVYRHARDPRLAFLVCDHHLNPVNVCHGGILATFADMQIAVLKPGFGGGRGHYPTINLSVDYLAPAPLGCWVEAEVALIKKTGRLVFTQALLTVNGGVVARSTAIYRNVTKSGDP